MTKWLRGPLMLLSLSMIGVYAGYAVCAQGTEGLAKGQERILFSSFASGEKFYIEKASFRSTGGSHLQYTIINENSQPPVPSRVSLNDIDCATGAIQSPVESWDGDDPADQNGIKPGPVSPMTLSKRNKLYNILKKACHENLSELPMAW